MDPARCARLCPCDGLRHEAAEILGAVPFDVGHHDTTGSVWWGQQRPQASTTAELYGHCDGNLGGGPALDCDFGHGAMTHSGVVVIAIRW